MRFLEREFRLAEAFKIETSVNKDDLDGIGHWIRGAKKQADWLVYGVHCHESGSAGEFHGGSRTSPPDFLVQFAHWAIDQGCDLFAGHGPHFMRGIETTRAGPFSTAWGILFSRMRPWPGFPMKAISALASALSTPPAIISKPAPMLASVAFLPTPSSGAV